MRRTVLLIAYHYPPCAESSGLQRTLSFSNHLRDHGWQPVVMSATAGSYLRCSDAQLADIPEDVRVVRTWAPDAARHLAIGGRHWSRLASPDRWRAWWLTAVPRALQVIREERADVIWSTYPLATAHAIAATIARRAGRPWVADFRDPMVEHVAQTDEIYPKDPRLRAARLRIESRVASQAARVVFCTAAARDIFSQRYPAYPQDHLAVVPNGFDEQAFVDAAALARAMPPNRRRLLLHSGTVYPGEDRDPRALLAAIKQLADDGCIDASTFELRLRAPSNEDYFGNLASDIGVAEFVTIAGPLPYRAALAEMLTADGLLLLQGHTSNPAVPAKLYEYLRARKPVLALADSRGETAALLRKLGMDTIAPLTDTSAIAHLINQWLSAGGAFSASLPNPETIAEFSRSRQARTLAELLGSVANSRPA